MRNRSVPLSSGELFTLSDGSNRMALCVFSIYDFASEPITNEIDIKINPNMAKGTVVFFKVIEPPNTKRSILPIKTKNAMILTVAHELAGMDFQSWLYHLL